jgi:hypothetical protein
MAKKKVPAKNVTATKGKESVTKKVTVTVNEPDPLPTPKPAIAEEPVMKVVDNGQATFLTKTEYDKKYGKKKAKKEK